MDILKTYGLRFHIEVAFRVLKHIIGGFGYRFWSLLSPSKNKGQQPIDWTENNPVAVKAFNVLRAIEEVVQRIFQQRFSLTIYHGFYAWIEKRCEKQLPDKMDLSRLNQEKAHRIRTLPHFLLN